VPRIVVVGSVNTDMVVRGDRIPAPGETVSGGTFLRADGGKGANQAVAAARLGARVTLVACVGNDELGRAAIEGLRAEGVDVDLVTRDPDRATGVALIMVDGGGENAISVAPGANSALSVDAVERARDVIASADVVLAQLEVPMEAVLRAVQIAADAGVCVVLNPAPARPLPEEVYRRITLLTPNRGEAALLAGVTQPDAAAGRLLELGAASVVVTLGPAGALLCDASGLRTVPGFAVEAVDSTAAGDAFNGALAVASAQGLPLDEAVRRACAAGALAATVPGARPSLPRLGALDAFLG